MTSSAISVLQKRLVEESAALGRQLIAQQVFHWPDGETRREQLFQNDHPPHTLIQQSIATMNRVSLETRNYGVQLTQAINALTTRQSHWAPECPICMDEMFLGEVSITRCGHIFHTECLQRSFELDQHRCSLCRVSLTNAECFKVHNGLPERPPPGISSATDRESRAMLAAYINSDEEQLRSSVDKAVSAIKDAQAFLRESNGTLRCCEELNKYASLIIDLRQRMISDYSNATKLMEHQWNANVNNHDRLSKNLKTLLSKLKATTKGLEEDRKSVQQEQKQMATITSQIETQKREIQTERESVERMRANVDKMRDEMGTRLSNLSEKEGRLNILFEITRNRIRDDELNRNNRSHPDLLSYDFMQKQVAPNENQQSVMETLGCQHNNPTDQNFALNVRNEDRPATFNHNRDGQFGSFQAQYPRRTELMESTWANRNRHIPSFEPSTHFVNANAQPQAVQEVINVNNNNGAGPSNTHKRLASSAIGDTNVQPRSRLRVPVQGYAPEPTGFLDLRGHSITPDNVVPAAAPRRRIRQRQRSGSEARNINRGLSTFCPNPRQVQRPSTGVARRSSRNNQTPAGPSEAPQEGEQEFNGLLNRGLSFR